MNNHIGTNFDDFLKEEFKEDFINILTIPNTIDNLKNELKSVLEQATTEGKIQPDYEIKKTKLPRKLKKKYKKQRRICFDVYYRQPSSIKEIIIPIESEDTNELN